MKLELSSCPQILNIFKKWRERLHNPPAPQKILPYLKTLSPFRKVN